MWSEVFYAIGTGLAALAVFLFLYGLVGLIAKYSGGGDDSQVGS